MFADITIKDYTEAPYSVRRVIKKWLNNESINQKEFNRVKNAFPDYFGLSLGDYEKALQVLGHREAKREAMAGGQRGYKEKTFRSKWVG